MKATGRLKALLLGRYRQKSLEGVLNSGDFDTNISALQEYQSSDDFYTGTQKFYSGGEIAVKTRVMDGGYSKRKEKRIVKSLASKLGGWIDSAKYGEPEVQGNKIIYKITDLKGTIGSAFCRGSKGGEVYVTFDKNDGTIDTKFVIKTETKTKNGRNFEVPMHWNTVRGYLNKIYYGFLKAGKLQYKYIVDARAAEEREGQVAQQPQGAQTPEQPTQPTAPAAAQTPQDEVTVRMPRALAERLQALSQHAPEQ